MEFLEVEAIPNAIELNETELHGRPLKVQPEHAECAVTVLQSLYYSHCTTVTVLQCATPWPVVVRRGAVGCTVAHRRAR